MTLSLDAAATALPQVRGGFAERLAGGLGIRTVRDLVEHYPHRLEDLGELADPTVSRLGEPVTVVAEVARWSHFRPPRKRRLTISTAKVRTASGTPLEVVFFNQRWRERALPPGTTASFSGTLERRKQRLQISSPQVQELDPDEDHRRLLPVHHLVDGVKPGRLRSAVEAALERVGVLDDHLDAQAWGLLDLDTAVRAIHFPPDEETWTAARRRLAFDELFLLQVGLGLRRRRLEATTAGLAHPPVDDGHAARLLATLPFRPTRAQDRAVRELSADLAAELPMHRLLQGDVGAGKTLVAVWTMLVAVDHGRQGALMAPTEVLAEQHARTLEAQLAPLGVNAPGGPRLETLTGSTPAGEARRILDDLGRGEVDLLVGTHALLEDRVGFADLGVVVVDEQHRFGVDQRRRLREQRPPRPDGTPSIPDVLVMTATPIPRSLALTVYGDLHVTVLDELPPGRQPITTQLITPEEQHRRGALEGFVAERAAAGERTYWVCPLVEPSEDVPAADVTTTREDLARRLGLDVGLVHGRMPAAEKEAALARFRSGATPVLVATTVVEVGVDVPEATVMVIEDAERFGISQLHQLRGRVGRGSARSYCVLFAGWRAELNPDALRRLEAVARTSDGFELAEVDLRLRGTGVLLGTRQSGRGDLRLARLTDTALVAESRRRADEVLDADPQLDAHPSLAAEIARRFSDDLDDLEVTASG